MKKSEAERAVDRVWDAMPLNDMIRDGITRNLIEVILSERNEREGLVECLERRFERSVALGKRDDARVFLGLIRECDTGPWLSPIQSAEDRLASFLEMFTILLKYRKRNLRLLVYIYQRFVRALFIKLREPLDQGHARGNPELERLTRLYRALRPVSKRTTREILRVLPEYKFDEGLLHEWRGHYNTEAWRAFDAHDSTKITDDLHCQDVCEFLDLLLECKAKKKAA